ncbi:MAG: hypothetical protein NTW33_00255 [Methanoregula sp.]|nr:hypothetical protein [Methanoregula sp.]
MIFFSKDFILLVFLALVISYSVGCLIDHFIKSRTIKIVIASVAALVSIVLGYLFIRSMNPTNGPIVCDPVHVPSDCELACRDAIGNTTGTTSIVAQKLDECLQNCYR